MGEAKRRKQSDPNWGKTVTKSDESTGGMRLLSGLVIPLTSNENSLNAYMNRSFFSGIELRWVTFDEFIAEVRWKCGVSDSDSVNREIESDIRSRIPNYEPEDSCVISDVIHFAIDFAQSVRYIASLKYFAEPLTNEQFESCFWDVCSWAVESLDDDDRQSVQEKVWAYFWNPQEAA